MELHRIERLGLVQLRGREDQIADGLRAEIDARHGARPADLAADGPGRRVERPAGEPAAARRQPRGLHRHARIAPRSAATTWSASSSVMAGWQPTENARSLRRAATGYSASRLPNVAR